MVKLTVVVGMPGSGKSHYIEKHKSHYPGTCTQDYMRNSYNNSIHFTDSQHYDKLVLNLRNGNDSIIADIEFCDTWRRVEIEEVIRRDVPGVEIEWRFFENDPAKCEANAETRARKNIDEEKKKIRELSRKYIVPPGAIVLRIWEPPK